MKKKVCIVDYKGGNIFSVQNTLNKLGAESFLSSDPKEIEKAEKIIFPGVGSFQSAMEHINELGLKEVLISKANSGIPFLGICVGMQVLFEKGSESTGTEVEGLGIFPGTIEKFKFNDPKLKIPHMGWNQVNTPSSENPLFKGIENNSDFYFVHSYMAKKPEKDEAYLASLSNYGYDFISSIWNRENLFACQFHPEKSAENGLKVIQNFLSL